ncbi:hypothetical protein L596_025388 [Steinernema carpocapsae]|uniref:Uncharacterized protein n=1 Tax=Steinernema carpocapsae TaxID=34508 RepID=A0A4U5M8G7_STECR|nr:hypothetical protein L596_025388 [Steinernema carpocapsae]
MRVSCLVVLLIAVAVFAQSNCNNNCYNCKCNNDNGSDNYGLYGGGNGYGNGNENSHGGGSGYGNGDSKGNGNSYGGGSGYENGDGNGNSYSGGGGYGNGNYGGGNGNTGGGDGIELRILTSQCCNASTEAVVKFWLMDGSITSKEGGAWPQFPNVPEMGPFLVNGSDGKLESGAYDYFTQWGVGGNRGQDIAGVMRLLIIKIEEPCWFR